MFLTLCSIPGTYGDFKCKSTTGSDDCNVYHMGMTDQGDFAYDFGTPDSVIEATGLQDNTDRSEVQLKLIKLPVPRRLQAETSQRLYNPVICIKEGDVIFFNVHSELFQYPRYFKDSILNTNPEFDYGPFTNLERMITV